KVIVDYILNLDIPRFTPTYTTIYNIANRLLATRTLYKDLVLIKSYIYNKDIYNFNKDSFIIDKITT
ncbi:hypothetical protein COCMIDRAFT_65449, partial [Bipolaris oryzae ATCC 44560]